MQSKVFNSLNVVILSSIIIALLMVNNGLGNNISWDTFGQYCYLPSFFIDHTFQVPLSHFENLNNTYSFSSTLYQFNVINEVAFTKYTAGLAFLTAPFFLTGHLFASLLGYPMDGYSAPYAVAFGIGCLFYTVLGIVVLRKLLLHFFDDATTAWSVPIIVFGTNFLANAVFGGAPTHTFSFLFLCLVILSTIKFHQNTTLKNGVFLGLSIGVLGLVRLPDLLFGLIPVFWNIKQYGSIFKKINYLFKNKRPATLVAIISFLLIISIQFFYWKNVSGAFFIDSYANNPGEGFDWFRPHTYPFLFSFKKGWLIYTPLAFIGLWGLFKLLFSQKGNYRLIAITFVVFLYVASSWTTWWYAGSFSQRSMVDVYPILGIAIGFVFSTTKLKKWVLGFAFLCVVLNLFQTWQMRNRIISTSLMTKSYYLSTFGQTTPTTEGQKQLLELDYADYEGYPSADFILTPMKTWDFIVENGRLSEENWYTKDIAVQLPDFYHQRKLYLIKTFWDYVPQSYNGLEGIIPNIAMMYKNKTYGWRGVEGSSPNLIIDTIKHQVIMEYLIPDTRTKKDRIRIQIWRKDPKDIEFTHVRVEMLEIKGKK